MRAIKLLCLAWLSVAASAWAAAPAVDEAQQLMAKGKLTEALQKLDGHLSSAPQDAEARFTRGLVLVRLNRNDEAAKAFTDLTRDYPQLPEPYNNLAVIYAQQGDYDKARDALEAALATHPSYPVAHENLGDIYAALAAAAYNRALSLDPNNPSARAKLNLVNQLDSLADSGATVMARGPTMTASAASGSPVAPAAAAASAATPAAASAAAAAASAQAPAGTPPTDAMLTQLVQGWAAAWSAKDVDKYLSYYSPEFTPEGGASREAWESQRRARIAKPKEIKVGVSDIKGTPLGPDRVQVEFKQDYASDALTNHSVKVLELAQVGGQWRIRREYTR